MINIRVLLLSVTLMLSLAGCVNESDAPDSSLAVGSQVPEFKVDLAGGGVLDSASLADSGVRWLLVIFFNTDCPDCRRELPEMQRLYELIQDDEMLKATTLLVCIAREEGQSEIQSFWDAHGLTMPFSPQPDRAIYNLFASVGIPRIYLIDTARSMLLSEWSVDYVPADTVFSVLKDLGR